MDEIVEYTKSVEESVFCVIKTKKGLYCHRCMNNDEKAFFKDELGYYCLKCLNFGKSSTYKLLRRKRVNLVEHEDYCLNKVIYLSEMQKLASLKCVDAYYRRYDLLIFAVCGAGKTEIVYDVILKALNDRKTICFATPRKDVVLELVPRFKRDFHHVKIVSLYGSSPDKGKLGNLYVSTTHQLINFYQFFDLIILDEVDAFPYYNNKMLEGFVKKAKKTDANIILLTATPTKHLKYLMRRQLIRYFIIPARFHRHPIPIPRVKLTSHTIELINKNKVPKKVLKWLLIKKAEKKQVFIFVPNIECGKKLHEILRSDFDCQFVYSESSDRKEVINQFRENRLQFIITTTILERGVTVSNVDVCILKCDDAIFDERAIVQIVGRSGRDKNYPKSDVVLFTDYYTLGIKRALKHLVGMNKLAAKKGLLKENR